MRGFPIRTSSDHGSFANSPRLIAGYHVLLRLLVPRHPPCALINLTTKIIQKDARVHCAVLKLRPAPAPSPQRLPTPHRYRRMVGGSTRRYQPAIPRAPSPPTGEETTRSDPETTTFRLFPQDPTACPTNPQPQQPPFPPAPRRARRTRRHQLESRPQSMFHPRAPSPTRSAGTTGLDATATP